MIEFAEIGNGTPELEELSVVGRDIQRKFGLSNENPDDLIARKGMAYIEELAQDAHHSSTMATRRQKLIEKGWKIVPAVSSNGKVTARNQEIRDFVLWNLENMAGAFEKDIEAFLSCLIFGFSLSELNYLPITRGKWQGKAGLQSIRYKPAKYFSFKFDAYGHYTINQIDPNPNGTALPGWKFVHLINGFNDENPYGDSLTSKCAFWIWLKKNQAKFWAIFNERFGSPLVDVAIPANKANDPATVTAAEEIIEDVAFKAGIRRPDNFNIGFLEATRRGDITYGNFIEVCNKEVSKVILGATLISEEGKRGQGSYALSSNMFEVMESYVIFDSIISQTAINEQIIKRLVDYNYVTAEYPKFVWSGISPAALISFAQGLAVLADKGLDIPTKWIHEKTGIPVPEDGEPTLRVTPAAQGSAGGNALGVDNRSFSELAIGNWQLGIDNFQDVSPEIQDEIREVDRMRERFANLMASRIENIHRRAAAALKKKVS